MNGLFELDRCVSQTDALIWLAATGSKEIKFEIISTTTVKTFDEDTGTFHFKDRINSNINILHGIHFAVPIKNFKLFTVDHRMFTDGENNRRTIFDSSLDLETSSEAVKTIKFDPPIYTNPYISIGMEYTFETGSEIHKMFNKTTIFDMGFLNPCLTAGLLCDLTDHYKKYCLGEKSTMINICSTDSSNRYRFPIIYQTQHIESVN